MITECGCQVLVHTLSERFEIVYCPLHAAAPLLLKTCSNLVKNLPESEVELAREVWGNTNTRLINDAILQAKFALAAAEGEEKEQ